MVKVKLIHLDGCRCPFYANEVETIELPEFTTKEVGNYLVPKEEQQQFDEEEKRLFDKDPMNFIYGSNTGYETEIVNDTLVVFGEEGLIVILIS